MSSASEQSVRCSDLRALPLHHQPAPRRRQAQAEVWGELGESGAIGAEAQFASLRRAGSVAEVAKEPLLQQRKTEPELRAKVRMVCRDMSKTSCHARYGKPLPMTHAECHQCATMENFLAS